MHPSYKISIHFFTSCTTSSSSITWSNPTFCPLECLALAPHTIALQGGTYVWGDEAVERSTLTISTALQFPCGWHCKNPQPKTGHAWGQLVHCSLALGPEAWYICRVVIINAGILKREAPIHSNHIQPLPHLLNQFIDVPPLFWWYRDGVWNFIQKVELFNWYSINLTERREFPLHCKRCCLITLFSTCNQSQMRVAMLSRRDAHRGRAHRHYDEMHVMVISSSGATLKLTGFLRSHLSGHPALHPPVLLQRLHSISMQYCSDIKSKWSNSSDLILA